MIITTSLLNRVAAAATACPNGDTNCDTDLPVVQASSGNLQAALQIIFGALGIWAVIMIVYGAAKLIMAHGDPTAAAKARGTVIYSVVGLVVAISAEIIVVFVVDRV